LEISTEITITSDLGNFQNLLGQDKVISICKKAKASRYYNSAGGRELYQRQEFDRHGISLHFLEANKIEYTQFGNAFVANLSILDVLMFNDPPKIRSVLTEYSVS
jgi:WbqC-like protein family.